MIATQQLVASLIIRGKDTKYNIINCRAKVFEYVVAIRIFSVIYRRNTILIGSNFNGKPVCKVVGVGLHIRVSLYFDTAFAFSFPASRLYCKIAFHFITTCNEFVKNCL